MIERKEYLKQLLSWKDQSIIKVLTGIRRCGKSTILKLYQEYLLNNGIDPSQIISINFEELEYEDLQDYKKLYQYIKDRLVENKMMYIFLDEIQNVPSYEKVVDSLHVKENIDIYITGSNSYIFSGQLATYLSGRYIEISVLPLSFKEVYNPQTNKEEAFQKYMKTGGFPYINQIQLQNEQIDMYLEGIYNTVIVKDIEERINRKNLIIICTTAIIITLLFSTTVLFLNNINNSVNNSINENNTNNTNSMDNSTTNTTKSTSKTTSKDTSSKSSSFSSDTINGEKITGIYPSYDEDYERIATATNKYYRNKKTGVIYKRHLDDDGVYRYY